MFQMLYNVNKKRMHELWRMPLKANKRYHKTNKRHVKTTKAVSQHTCTSVQAYTTSFSDNLPSGCVCIMRTLTNGDNIQTLIFQSA